MMARHRRRRMRHHAKRQSGVMRWINKLITPTTFAMSAVSQITAKDVAAYPGYTALPNTEKAKFLGNSLVSHLTNFSPFPQYGSPGITINPTGPINKFTGMGVVLMILGEVMPGKLGGKSLARKAGKGFFWGGVLGGFLDPGSGARSGGNSVRTGTRGTQTMKSGYAGANMGY